MNFLKSPDRRRNVRNLCSELIEFSFDDSQGNSVTTVALVEDVSDTGLCVSSSLPVSPGRWVRVQAEGLSSGGIVRYCELGDYSYLLGLELEVGWRGEWSPGHELPLSHLDDA